MKFSKFFLLAILFFVSCNDIGKGYLWQNKDPVGFSRRFGTVGYDYGWNAAYSPFDEGIIIVGQRSPIIGGKSDLWAIKTNNRGIMEWEKTFGGDQSDIGYDVISTSDGGFMFVGHTWSFGAEQQMYVIKTDFHGIIQWEKTYGGSMWEVGNAVIELLDGNFLIIGYSNSPGISSGNTDIFLVKIDNVGNIIWQKSYGNKAFPNHEWAYDGIQLADEGFMIVGSRDRYNDGSLNALIVRIDAVGNLIWEKELLGEGQTEDVIYSVSNSIDGYYYLCSGTNSISSPEIFQPKIIKMDGAGNIDWQRVLNNNGKNYHEFRATVTTFGEIIVVGSSSQSLPLGNKENAFMTKINSNGNILWTYPYGSTDQDDWAWAVFETPRSNLVFVGSTKSFGASLFDIYLVGTDSEGIYR